MRVRDAAIGVERSGVAGIVLLLFAFIFFLWTTGGINPADESWFLEVSKRVASGEVLYRDVFFGSGPLSVYISSTLVRLFGAEIIITKALASLIFALTVMASMSVARLLSVPVRHRLLLGAAIVVMAFPGWDIQYNPLSNLLLLGAFYAVLKWRERADEPQAAWLAMAGIAAGLSFATKQTTGFYTLIASFGVLLVVHRETGGTRRELIDRVLTLCATFMLTVALALAPVALSGGLEGYLEYGFLNKGTYLALGKASYFDSPYYLLVFLSQPRTFDHLQRAFWLASFVIPFASLGALIWVWLRGDGSSRATSTAVFAFAGASLMGLFPRPDRPHLAYALPGLLVGLAYAASRLSTTIFAGEALPLRAKRITGFIVWAALIAAIISMALAGGARVISPDYRVSKLPHFRNVLMGKASHDAVERTVVEIRKEAEDGGVFIISPSAGFYYLASDINNPTPFDYPVSTAFGRSGQMDVVKMIESGEIRSVLLDTIEVPPDNLKPATLQSYVKERMKIERAFGKFVVYRR